MTKQSDRSCRPMCAWFRGVGAGVSTISLIIFSPSTSFLVSLDFYQKIFSITTIGLAFVNFLDDFANSLCLVFLCT